MRIFNLKIYFILFFRSILGPILGLIILLNFSSCAPKPEKIAVPPSANVLSQLPPEHLQAVLDRNLAAIWFATSNFTNGGTLARLDLRTGQFDTHVLEVGRDPIIVSDGTSGLFLLNRMGRDSISLLSGSQAQTIATYAFNQFSNPQFAARDALGRVWVISLDLNDVTVLSPGLEAEVGQVDLSSLAINDSIGSYASLSQIKKLDDHRMIVAAQRLHRGSGVWKPDKLSGLAIVDIDTLISDSILFLSSPNPIRIFSKNEQFYVLGAGDFSSPSGPNANIISLNIINNKGQNQAEITSSYSFAIIDADVDSDPETPAIIAWHKSENKTCLQLGEQQIYCEQGSYVFNKVLKVGNVLYASYCNLGNSELWILQTNTGTVNRYPMHLPIQSMVFGP